LKILGGCREARHRAFRFNPREARGISTAIPAACADSIMTFCWRIVPEAGDDARHKPRWISTAIPAACAHSIMTFCWRIVPEAGDDASS